MKNKNYLIIYEICAGYEETTQFYETLEEAEKEFNESVDAVVLIKIDKILKQKYSI